MHYAFDSWLEREWPTVQFERFADDAVVHCATERQARQVWAALAERMESVGLQLHPDKTKIVYCGDSNRRQKFEVTSLRFWGIRSVLGSPKRGGPVRYLRRSSPR